MKIGGGSQLADSDTSNCRCLYMRVLSQLLKTSYMEPFQTW